MTNGLYGKFRGEVMAINDPDMRGRVLVRVPSVLNQKDIAWAESCFPPGLFQLPRIGDFVWVEFEGGDIGKPIWVGIMPTRAYVKEHLYRGGTFYALDNHEFRPFDSPYAPNKRTEGK